MKLTKADIDKVRHIEGFPIATDEDIISLSDPPYYTACPNPFIEDFIKQHGKPYDEATDDYHREPFASDVSEGKNDPIYNAHSYHTKVPHKAIMRYILHYTNPGDIVFDGFCGSGMTGVAAQMCENPDSDFKWKIEQEMPEVKWGARKAILNDLSPAATFIAYNYNTPVDVAQFEQEAKRIIEECEREYGWMYETKHTDEHGNVIKDIYGNEIMGKINYTVWSDVFICPNCGEEMVFYDVAFDSEKKEVKDRFHCHSCGVQLKKQDCKRANKAIFDRDLNQTITMAKQVPVLINYNVNKKRFEKTPDEYDMKIIEKVQNYNHNLWYPKNPMMNIGEKWGDSWRAGYHFGITHVHHFYKKRNLINKANIVKYSQNSYRHRLLWLINSIDNYINNKQSFTGGGGGLSGTIYIPSLIQEKNIFDVLKRKINKININIHLNNSLIVTNQSVDCLLNFTTNSMDYIFTDPPFGDNLNYSELSFIWEAWLKVITNNKTEAIMNKSQQKGLHEYQALMTRSFQEYYRVLKPGRWMTVVFHNSKNAVWNAIQESLQMSGFVIADVRTLDKMQGSFKQVTTSSAVKQDLVISAYKPKDSFKREFLAHAGSEETAWDFTRQHLEKLPVVVKKNERMELITERQAFLLFDRMVAYHIMNGIPVPIDASDYYKGLAQKYLMRDQMYFLHDQVNEYDTARITIEIEPIQMDMFVSNERSAIAWLYQLLDKPQTYAEIQPKFMQEIRSTSIEKHEQLPELSILLEENFLQNEMGQWYIPDIHKSADVVKLRDKRLVKEFEEYLKTTGKLKLFRTEAVRAGFAKLLKDKNYGLIIKTAERLPESVLQEDDKLLMYYDVSVNRVGS